jgi:hypothetical protein
MKRSGIARLIPWLIGLDVLLLTAFLIVRFFDIHIGGNETPISLPDQQVVSMFTPEPFSMGEDPEQLLIDSDAIDRPSETSLPLENENQQMTLVAGSFAQRGGPDFSLYLDQSSFQLIENEGRCYFCPMNSAGELYLEISYYNGVSADVLSASVFQDYGIIIQKDEVQDSQLNGRDAKHVSAKTMENHLEAFILDADGGCVTLVFCTPGTSSNQLQSSLNASLNSFALK